MPVSMKKEQELAISTISTPVWGKHYEVIHTYLIITDETFLLQEVSEDFKKNSTFGHPPLK